jgi:hypothetical protein
MSVRTTIIARITEIAEQQGKQLAPLTDDLPLMESGLDSLCIAVLVASLEDEIGQDPFDGDGPVAFPVTLGDFIGMYENASA